MYQMFVSSVRLFLRGKLFRDNSAVFKQWLIGFAVSCLTLLAIGWFTSPLIGAAVAGLIGGALQPYLFKDLKYA